MRRMLMSMAAATLLVTGAPGPGTAREADPEKDCRDYCGKMAAQRCEDVSSTWCNVYIIGCLAGCGVAHL